MLKRRASRVLGHLPSRQGYEVKRTEEGVRLIVGNLALAGEFFRDGHRQMIRRFIAAFCPQNRRLRTLLPNPYPRHTGLGNGGISTARAA